jgi:predicted transcriptional regulator
MKNIAQELRESAKATFYEPLKSELNRAADRIDELERELKRLIDYGLVSFQDLDRARAVLGETCSD